MFQIKTIYAHEAGDAANSGCPDLPEELISFMKGDNATLYFVVNSAMITDESSAKLKKLTELLGTYTSVDVVIEGHASADGSMSFNQTLSEKRAGSVKEALVSMGVEASRLETLAEKPSPRR